MGAERRCKAYLPITLASPTTPRRKAKEGMDFQKTMHVNLYFTDGKIRNGFENLARIIGNLTSTWEDRDLCACW